MAQLLFAVCVALAASRQVPAGLATAPPDAAGALTSIVVADIDRDGDADVVATDDALHLFVWINDGTGRLTQQRPTPTGDGLGAAQGPGVERGTAASAPFAPTDPPTFDASAASWSADALPCAGRPGVGSNPDRRAAGSARRLRGPPPALL